MTKDYSEFFHMHPFPRFTHPKEPVPPVDGEEGDDESGDYDGQGTYTGDDGGESEGGIVGGGESDGGADDSHPLDFMSLRCRRSITIAQAVLPRIRIGIPSH